jgi:hypothetical protein
MVREEANRLRAGRLSRRRPDGESRRMPVDWMLGKGTALMRFAHLPPISSFSSNAGELRLQSHHLVGFPMENRPTLTRRGGAYELPNMNEGCETPQGGTPRTP